ncbi:MAG: DUF3995 domain-containing protein [Hyphococcus sp.]
MKILASLLFILLAGIATIHVYWAFGGHWPAANEQELVETVIGVPNMPNMPSTRSTLVVAALILLTAYIALAAGGVVRLAPIWFVRLMAAGAGLVFFARGVAGYFFDTVAWTPVEPFATLNRFFYSPVCLAIAVAFLLLALASQNPKEE